MSLYNNKKLRFLEELKARDANTNMSNAPDRFHCSSSRWHYRKFKRKKKMNFSLAPQIELKAKIQKEKIENMTRKSNGK